MVRRVDYWFRTTERVQPDLRVPPAEKFFEIKHLFYVVDDIMPTMTYLEEMAWGRRVFRFGEWWNDLNAAEQKSVDFTVTLLSEAGPTLKMPHSSGIETSRHRHMRELRIQHEGRPYRVLYAFDPRRTAILPIGGDKTGNTDGTRSTFLAEMIFTISI